MKVITICDHKGGVAKTTTAAALAQGIARLHPKAKTLLIDADPQGTATQSVYGIKKTVPGLYEVILDELNINEAIIETEAGNIIPYSPKLRKLDAELQDEPGKNFFIKERLEGLKGYTHVIIDTSPYLNLANIQALTASDSVIIPIGANPETVESLPATLTTIQSVKKYLNSDLVISGAVITLYDGRSNVVKQYAELISDICKKNKVKLLDTKVRTCSAIKEAHALKCDLFEHAPKSNAVKDYTAVIKELKL
jgi:chromosome partitioning protein